MAPITAAGKVNCILHAFKLKSFYAKKIWIDPK